MDAHKPQKVRLRYRCSLQDGRICHIGEGETMEFWLGAGRIAPTLERALAEMQPGERRLVRIPAAEVPLIPFSKENESPPGISYEFGPGDGGDVEEYIPQRPRHPREEIPADSDVDLEIQLLSVGEPASE
ncbi:FKBP-type peptidyl-prolyl cis-trans isomerase [Geomonas sp.]|uniref:FKBP-type peptidyl-prolyl cis-trans isomerase n=1 Tax=Geomonas sp. TaxID=2651584 RepID=UPI002B4A58DB|nr:FKBP-type peptidyl-prolyl cis-trans isomerase [Geomonas sp.]HJV34897.1 FKBP-type peptidyl-prolyl cis-trans isomerase [Geomonas sp.]